MFRLKDGITLDFVGDGIYETYTELADYMGIDRATLSRILRRKSGCKKVIAIVLTMLYDGTDEIERYFEKM